MPPPTLNSEEPSKVALDMSRYFRWTVSQPPSSEDLDLYPATTRPTPHTTPTPSIMKSRFDRLGTRRFRGLRRWAWWPGLSLLAGGQSGCSTTPYQQHVVSYNPERKLSLEATEASRESSQRVRKTNTPLSTASATV